MTDVLDPAPIIEAAQQAAAAADYSEAERLLREAAALQELSLGSLHPDLASTLNNLALVCERTNKFDEAERGYRRAHAIAVASLGPGHPFATTSLKNLVDFCAAHEIPIWKPSAAGPDDETSSPEPEAKVPRAGAAGLRARQDVPPRAIAVATLGVAVAVAVAFALQRSGTTDTSDPLPQAQNKSSANDSPATSVTTTALIGQHQPTVTLERRADTTPAPVNSPNPLGTSITSAGVSALNAQLCSALEKERVTRLAVHASKQRSATWHVHFLHATADEHAEHRWYRGERVQQVRRLRVAASPGSGYRTFSSNTVSPERAGDWKVELRGADRTVLWEEYLVIR